MKWIAVLLMIANVVVYLWASGYQNNVDETVINAKPDVNREGMLMLSEIGDLKQVGNIAGSQQSVSELVGLEKKPTKADNSDRIGSQNSHQITGNSGASISNTDKVPAPTKSAVSALLSSCYRLGPFKKEASWQAAIQWMKQHKIAFQRVTSESREFRAVRVYLGPYQSASAAESTVRLLKSKNLDHFLYLAKDDSVRISLGYFTQEALAEKFLAHLQSLDVQAKSQAEYRQLGPFNWLVIAVGSTKDKQFISHDWAEPNVGLSHSDC